MVELQYNIEQARQETLNDLNKLETCLMVEEEGLLVRDLPMVSFGYRFCSALILRKGERMLLSHIRPTNYITEGYIEVGIDMMGKEISELTAMAVGGKYKDFIQQRCDQKGLKLAEGYLDERREEEMFREKPFHSRDIIVIPALAEVWIYTHKGKITRSM